MTHSKGKTMSDLPDQLLLPNSSLIVSGIRTTGTAAYRERAKWKLDASITCPTCGAAPLWPCRTRKWSRKKTTVVHQARADAVRANAALVKMGSPSAPTKYFEGGVAKSIRFNRALTAAEIQMVEDSLGVSYGVKTSE
jgi:hypothetical protein